MADLPNDQGLELGNGKTKMLRAPEEDGVSLSISGQVATISLTNVGKRNALCLRTWLALPSLIAEADAAPGVRVILMRGEGGNFGSGNDISEIAELRGKPDAAKFFGAAMADAMRACESATRPLVMAIEGACYGASVALALCADMRIAADSAVFAITPAKLGAVYLQSDIHRLVRAIGAGQSHRMIFLAEPIDADEAVKIGLIQKVVPAGQFETHVDRMIDAIAKGSPFTLIQTKDMVRYGALAKTPRETNATLALFVAATQGDDFGEGVQAFLDKRSPVFGSR